MQRQGRWLLRCVPKGPTAADRTQAAMGPEAPPRPAARAAVALPLRVACWVGHMPARCGPAPAAKGRAAACSCAAPIAESHAQGAPARF
eukprot:872488-Prymnesium_polylepis.1